MEFKYRRDTSFFEELKRDDTLKMESLRLLLDYFMKKYEFQMPEVVRENSMIYLDENDGVRKFVSECVVEEAGKHFTLVAAKELYKSKDYCSNRLGQFKQDLEKALNCTCVEQTRIEGKKLRKVFFGYTLVYTDDY
jgi:phage/plasmid-associated DNA primase